MIKFNLKILRLLIRMFFTKCSENGVCMLLREVFGVIARELFQAKFSTKKYIGFNHGYWLACGNPRKTKYRRIKYEIKFAIYCNKNKRWF